MSPRQDWTCRLHRAMAGLLLVAAAALGSGCATTSAPSVAAPTKATVPTPGDPFEAYNRKVFAFNDAIDRAVLEPVAKAYRDVVPQIVRTGISNVLGNIGDVWSAANQFLQGKAQLGLEMSMRVMTNTFFGLGGLLDPATEFGLTRRSEDFGQTLGRWGVGPGPFVMLPFLGPSTVRDTAGRLLDDQASASRIPTHDAARGTVSAIQILDLRASLLGASALLDTVALDRYSFLRDAYLQRRLDAVYDGAPPLLEDPGDDPSGPAPANAAPAPAKASEPPPKAGSRP
ncbi:MAG: VacJ family lipoprotein [Rubrivivax sp.]|nr:VacJ family lipoprotein [Rubrivivax sp.]